MAYYGSINRNFNVRELRSTDDTAMASLISYSQDLFYGIDSNSSWISASALRARTANSDTNYHGFALVHRTRGLIAYKEVYYAEDDPESLILTYNFEKSGNKNRIGNRLENWFANNVSEFSNVTHLIFDSPLNPNSASAAFATRWSGKTKVRKTQVKSGTSMITNPNYKVRVVL